MCDEYWKARLDDVCRGATEISTNDDPKEVWRRVYDYYPSDGSPLWIVKFSNGKFGYTNRCGTGLYEPYFETWEAAVQHCENVLG